MAALPVIAGVFRTTLNWRDADSGKTAHNVHHFKDTGGEPADVFAALEANFTTAMWDWVATSARIESVSVLPLDGTSSTTVFPVLSAPANFQGQGTGQSIPQAAGIIKATTGVRGRQNRGRTYLPFLAEGEQDGGVLSDLAATQTAWNSFRDDMNTSLVIPVVASYFDTGHENGITAYVAEPTSATQRRRQRR